MSCRHRNILSVALSLCFGFGLSLATTALGTEKRDTDYFASGFGVGVGYDSLNYFHDRNTIHRFNGGVLELTTPNLSTPSAVANLSLYGRLGEYTPTKTGFDSLTTVSGGFCWHGLATGSTKLKTHLQLGLGVASADGVSLIADVLAGFEYAVARSFGLGVDLHSYVGLESGADLALMARYHF